MEINQNIQYHKVFNNVGEKVLNHVRATIKKGLFKHDIPIEIKLRFLKELAIDLSNYYDIEVPEIELADCRYIGQYIPALRKITMAKPSLVTFLYEFRCHIHHQKNMDFEDEQSRELDIIGWSHSVYYLATPNLFKNAVKNGLLIHQKTFEEDN